jgi:pimeloyl-ACP methyl ester carboxylesterase
MAPVARQLSRDFGVLEPLQSADTLDGQIDELRRQLTEHGDSGFTLIGSSWGAVLALFFASRHKAMVDRLILIGSAVFDAHYSELINPLRKSRVSPENLRQFEELEREKAGASPEERDRIFQKSVGLLFEGDAFDPITLDLELIEVQTRVNHSVWADFLKLRDEPGRLEREFSTIDMPVTVIHGDYDPHLIDGIRPYLSAWMPQTSFHILANCGHYPWIERQAREEFYRILRSATS